MFANHPAARTLAGLGVFAGQKKPAPAKPAAAAEPVLDAARALKFLVDSGDLRNIVLDAVERSNVAGSLQQWAETTADDLGEGEGMSDRLFAMLIGIADENKDGDLTDAEVAVVTTALENSYEYLVDKGVSEEDAVALLQDGNEDAAVRVAELLKGALPDGEEGEEEDVDSFTFDAESTESLFDSVIADVFKGDPVLDAVYKKKIVVRGGRKMRINKRVSGRVVLSAAQKIAIRKARRKAHSSVARVHRAKSMKMRARAGL